MLQDHIPVFYPGPHGKLSLLSPIRGDPLIYEDNRYNTPVQALAAFYLVPSLRQGKNCFCQDGCLSSIPLLRAWLNQINFSEDPSHIRLLRRAAFKPDADIGSIVTWICFGSYQDKFDVLVDFYAMRRDLGIRFDSAKKINVDGKHSDGEYALTNEERYVLEHYIIPAMFRDKTAALQLLSTENKHLVYLDIPSWRLAAAWTYRNPLHNKQYTGFNGLGLCLEAYRAKLQIYSESFLKQVEIKQRPPSLHEVDEVVAHTFENLRVY